MHKTLSAPMMSQLHNADNDIGYKIITHSYHKIGRKLNSDNHVQTV